MSAPAGPPNMDESFYDVLSTMFKQRSTIVPVPAATLSDTSPSISEVSSISVSPIAESASQMKGAYSICSLDGTTLTESPESVQEIHERYYFADGNITFLVKGTLFKVHRYFFKRDSAVFREVILKDLDLDKPQIPVVELSHCTAQDFACFLGVLYPTEFHQHTAKTLAEWSPILALGTHWGFASIRLLAIRELTALAAPVDKIILGTKYGVGEWLAGAYEAVCVRAEPLSDEEAVKVGAVCTARVARVRERLARGESGLKGETTVLREVVRVEFGLVETGGDGGCSERGQAGAETVRSGLDAPPGDTGNCGIVSTEECTLQETNESSVRSTDVKVVQPPGPQPLPTSPPSNPRPPLDEEQNTNPEELEDGPDLTVQNSGGDRGS